MKHNWEYKRLGDICDFERGLTYSNTDESDSPSNNIILRSNNIDLDTFSLSFSDLKYLNPEFNISESKKIKANSILICMSNGSLKHLGKTAYISKDYNMAFGGFMGLIIPKSQNPKYISFIFRSKLYYKFLSNLNRGANIRNIQFSKLSGLSIPVPPMAVQERIVEELDAINGLIEKNREVLCNLDALAQSLFYNTFGDPIANPKGWTLKTLGTISTVLGGSTPKTNIAEYWNGDLCWITPAELKGDKYIFNTERHISELGRASAGLLLFPKNTVLLTSRAPIGKVAIAKAPMYCNQGFKNLICDKKQVHFQYVFFFLSLITDVLNEKGSGATFKEISKRVTESISIPVPPLELQEKFAERIEQIDAQKAKVETAIAQLQTLLDSRMDYWFN